METRPIQSDIGVGVLAATATAAIEWAWSSFPGRVCVLSSMQDAVVIDLAMRVDRRIPIVFLDTGYHFAETLQVLADVEARYDIRVETVLPVESQRVDIEPGECCAGKAELLMRALDGREAWITGLQRCETAHRADADIIDVDRRGATKVSPIAQWSETDRAAYIERRHVITHPLLDQGYDSIGCAPCTSRPSGGARSGRWAGTDQTECGLHL